MTAFTLDGGSFMTTFSVEVLASHLFVNPAAAASTLPTLLNHDTDFAYGMRLGMEYYQDEWDGRSATPAEINALVAEELSYERFQYEATFLSGQGYLYVLGFVVGWLRALFGIDG